MPPLRHLPVPLFLALLFLPLVQTLLGLFDIRPLDGVEIPAEGVPATAASWLDGRLQESWEKRFNAVMGLRPLLVRTDNELNLDLFHRTQKNLKTPIVLGKDDFLYEKLYIDRYNRPTRREREDLLPYAAELARLQGLLARRGIAFLLAISPSKAEIYPEKIPEGEVVPGRSERTNDYDLFTPILAEQGVNVLDVHRLFVEERRRSEAMLFARGGVHWNHYGATLAVARIMEELSRLSGRPLPGLDVSGWRTDNEVWRADNDLGNLLNVWTIGRYIRPQTHPLVTRVAPEGARPPTMLMVGDSFVLTLAALLEENRLTDKREILYYFKRTLDFPGERSEPFDPETYDVAAALRGVETVVIETNEIFLPKAGFGFVEKALQDLANAKEPLPTVEAPSLR